MAATILIIEDYSTHRVLLHRVASDMGCQAIDAADGRSGLALAHEHDPMVIVLDLVLPDVDGVEVLRRLRRDPVTAHTPVLIGTALDAEKRVIEALEAGADDYVTKPFNAAVLKARLKVLLRAARLQRALAQEAQRAEATARLAQAATARSGEETCRVVAEVLRDHAQAQTAAVYVLRDDAVVGPYGLPQATPQTSSLDAAVKQGWLAQVLGREAPWLRVQSEALGLFSEGISGDAAVLPLRHGERLVGLVVLAAADSLHEPQLRRVAKLCDAAGAALAARPEVPAVSDSDSRYRLLFDRLPEGAAIVNVANGVCAEVNHTLAGWVSSMPAAIEGRPFAALFEPSALDAVRGGLEAAAQGRKTVLSAELVDEARRVPVEVVLQRLRTGAHAEVLALVRERNTSAPAALPELATLAQTVRGLNHAINNPLTCIIGLTQLLQMRLRAMPEHQSQLATILDSAERITELSRQLRDVAMAMSGHKSAAEVEQLLADLDQLQAG